MSIITEVSLNLVKVPLKTPYKLAFGDVTHLDSIVVQVRMEDGGYGLGEATFLPSYGSESPADAWSYSRLRAEDFIGRDPRYAKHALDMFHGQFPFSNTALTVAIEMAQDNPLFRINEEMRVPILGAIASNDLDVIPSEVEALLKRGYKTIKVKVGFNLDEDLIRVKFIQTLLAGRAMIRLDGNQGYSRDEACRFARSLMPNGIELLEQPCAASDWDAAAAVAAVSRVPMMLDESIYGLEEIDRAADLGIAQYIKLKVLKMGGAEALVAALEHIRERGMEPVLGNGVANDIACWQEACCAVGHIRNAGEFNGFLRPVCGLLNEPLPFEGDCIVLEPGYRPTLDQDRLQEFGVKQEQYRKTSINVTKLQA